MSDTVLDRIVACLAAALEHNPNAQVPPLALLWPDEASQWVRVIDRLRERVPLLTLGVFVPEALSGPGYWIRCVLAGTVDAGLAEGTPIVYMPGVGRAALRAVDSCPPLLAPIAELQYRSQWFSHPNARDWSVRALLSHRDMGVGLRIADDPHAGAALILALERLLDESVARLEGQDIDADLLNELVNPDPMRSVLGWLDDAAEFRSRITEEQWAAFLHQCISDYGLDTERDGTITAARMLAERKGSWSDLWNLYADAPRRYPGIADQLRKARPEEQLAFDDASQSDVWPQDNEIGEDQLRSSLRDFETLTAEGARKEIARLDAAHSWRRGTVWAELDQAPLAFALEQLVLLSEFTSQPVASDGLQSLVADYAERGWRADDAIVRSLQAVPNALGRTAAAAAARAMYWPWLDAAAKALQAIVGPMANDYSYQVAPRASMSAGTVTLFVDGLRLDVAHRLQDRLAAAGLDVQATTGLAALPTVTQTAKPAVVPIADSALTAGPDLDAANSITGTKASIQVLRSLMIDCGVQILAAAETGDPSGTSWAEVGEIDRRGHELGIRLVDSLEEELDRVATRIRELIDAGWSQVDVRTDHGWILLPGGMEKVELAPATVEVKKGRCARLKPGAVVDVPMVPWHWDHDVRIAVAPGATCFEAGKQYEHGGVSPQECIVPHLTVTAGVAAPGKPELTSLKWLGLLCRIELLGGGDGVRVDLRALPADANTSIAQGAKETSSAGRVSLVVPDEDHEGEPAFVVLLAPDGRILAQRPVVVGKNR